MQIFTSVVYFTIFILTVIIQWKKNKVFKELSSITYIFQLGAIFDIWSLFFRNQYNAAQNIVFLYSLVFTLYVIFSNYINNGRKNIVQFLLFILIPIFCICVDFKLLYKILFKYVFLIILFFYLVAILTCLLRCFQFNIKLKAVNYFFFLLLGFILIDLFYYLGFYHVIEFKMSIWMVFLNFYLIYLNVIRLIYIFYVSKNF